jgi:hypothetical protein
MYFNRLGVYYFFFLTLSFIITEKTEREEKRNGRPTCSTKLEAVIIV